jgi:hypothetical protein
VAVYLRFPVAQNPEIRAVQERHVGHLAPSERCSPMVPAFPHRGNGLERGQLPGLTVFRLGRRTFECGMPDDAYPRQETPPLVGISGATRLIAVLGDPVAQVRAPALMNGLLARHQPADHPQLPIHRGQTRHQRHDRTPRRHHRKPLDATSRTHRPTLTPNPQGVNVYKFGTPESSTSPPTGQLS